MALLWNFSHRNANASLPAFMQDEDLYKGSFVSTNNKTTRSNRSSGAKKLGSQKSGKTTNAFSMALCRARQIACGSNRDGFGENSRGYFFAEFTDNDDFHLESNVTLNKAEIYTVACDTNNGKIYASRSGSSVDASKDIAIAAIHLALWSLYMKDAEFMNEFNTFCSETDENELKRCVCVLADNAYYQVADKTNPVINLSVANANSSYAPKTSLLSSSLISTINFKVETLVGTFENLEVLYGGNSSSGGTSDGRIMDTSEFVGKYSLRTDEEMTEEERSLVPKLDEKYIVGETLVNICEHIHKSTQKGRPIRNILLRGEPGTGKTAMYKGIAAACNLPLYTFAANAMTEPYDLFGQFVPVDEDEKVNGHPVSIQDVIKDLPQPDEMVFDPVGCYFKLTGENKSDATSNDCMNAVFEKMRQNQSKENENVFCKETSDGRQKFKFVPGQLIYAMKNGGLWGFDEVTLPQNAGVVPALNPAMDGTQALTLPTGEIVRRHPACIFVGTTNVELEGCRRVNQAWQDRCQLIIDVEEPSDSELIARVKSMTDYDDVADKNIDLSLFVKVYKELKEIARKKRLDDGQIGPRKLADWVMSTMITGNPVQSAKWTIISGATADPDGIAELTTKVQDTFL